MLSGNKRQTYIIKMSGNKRKREIIDPATLELEIFLEELKNLHYS